MKRTLEQPGFWMAALLTFMAVMVQAVLSLPLTLLDQLVPQFLNRPAPGLSNQPFVVGFVNVIAFGVAVAVGLILNRLPLRSAFPLGLPTVAQFGAMAVAVLGGDILLSELDNVVRSLVAPPRWLIEAYESLLSPETGLPGRIFLLVVVAPVTEELFFRGVVLRGLLPRFPAWAAVGLSSFLFAAGHVNPWQAVSAFWLGVIFGWFYLRTGSVLVCIVGHAISNGFFVLFTSTALEIPGLTGTPSQEVAFQPWWLNLSGAFLLAIGVLSFLKAAPRRESDHTEEAPQTQVPSSQTPPPIPAAGSEPPVITERFDSNPNL